MGATSTESVKFSNIGAVNTAAFTLKGGRYAVVTKSTGAGMIDLTTLAADGGTFVKTITSIATVAGYAVIDLPPGQYRFEVATFTANFLSVTSVPI
jgi:hypothetical protein